MLDGCSLGGMEWDFLSEDGRETFKRKFISLVGVIKVVALSKFMGKFLVLNYN